MAALYEYRSTGRRPLTMAGLAMSLTAILALNLTGAGALAHAAAWGAMVLALANFTWWMRVSGCRIDAGRMTTFIDGRHRSVPLARIARVRLTETRLRRILCRLELSDGTALTLPACCVPPLPVLTRTLRLRGVEVLVTRQPRG